MVLMLLMAAVMVLMCLPAKVMFVVHFVKVSPRDEETPYQNKGRELAALFTLAI